MLFPYTRSWAELLLKDLEWVSTWQKDFAMVRLSILSLTESLCAATKHYFPLERAETLNLAIVLPWALCETHDFKRPKLDRCQLCPCKLVNSNWNDTVASNTYDQRANCDWRKGRSFMPTKPFLIVSSWSLLGSVFELSFLEVAHLVHKEIRTFTSH